MTEFLCLICNDMEDVDGYEHPLPPDEVPTTFGIGVFLRIDGRPARIAVKMSRSAGFHDFKRAWKRLSEAVNNPQKPESKTAWDEEVLTGNEIEV